MSEIVTNLKSEIAKGYAGCDKSYDSDGAVDWENAVEELGYGDLPKEGFPLEDGSIVTCEHSWGGEGEGDSIGCVLKIARTDGSAQYIKIAGFYDSWQGSDFSYADVCLVEPYKRTITDYRKVEA